MKKIVFILALFFCFPSVKSQDLEQLLMKADSYWKANDLPKAIEGYQNIINTVSVPEIYQSLVYLRLAQAQYGANKYNDSRKTLKEMASLPYIREHHRLKMDELLKALNGIPINHRTPLPVYSKVAGTIYVSQETTAAEPDGTISKPFKTLEEGLGALEVIMKGSIIPEGVLEIVLKGKKYNITQPVKISGGFSGTERNPVLIRSFSATERTEVNGGRNLFAWRTETSPHILSKVPPDVRFNLIFCSLGENLVTGIDSIVFGGGWGSARGSGTKAVPELFYDGKPQTLARWPNNSDTVFPYNKFSGERAKLFSMEKDVWLHGYWKHLWADTYEKLKYSETSEALALVPPLNLAGFENEKWHVVNALAAIDNPGEYKICARGLENFKPDEWNYPEPSSGTIWYYPPENFNADLCMLSVYGPAFIIDGFDYLTFKDIDFRYIRGDALKISNSNSFSLIGCVIQNVSGNGIKVYGGRHHLFHSCTIQSMGRGGIEITSGDIPGLESSECVIENCVIRDLSRIDRTYTPAVLMQGVGIKVQYCRFDKIPSSAIRIEGNDMLIQLSEFSNCNTESDDQGTIESFNNPLFRGNTIRWNYFHDIGEDPTYMAAGVRLDDAICGYIITENIFVNASRSVFGGVQIHGGKDNIIEGNVFTDCNAMISQSAWEEKRWLASMKTHPILTENDYWKSDIWQKRYPDLQDVFTNYDKNYSTDNLAVNAHAFYLRASSQIEILNDQSVFDNVVKRSLSGIRENYIQPWHEIPIDEIGPYAPRCGAVFKDSVQIDERSDLADKSAGPGHVSASLFVSRKALAHSGDGSISHPYFSIEDALKAAASIIKIRDLPEGIIEIVVIDRKHVLQKPVLLTQYLSGTKANPIIIRPQGKCVLSGGVNLFAWKQDHGALAKLLPLNARRKVIIADLQENGVDATNLVLPDDSDPGLNPFPELYYDGKLQNVASYPIGDGISSSFKDFKHADLHIWTAERDVWVKGYSAKMKSGVYAKVENNEANVLSLKKNYKKLDIDHVKWHIMNTVTAIGQTGDYKIGTRGLFESKDNTWGYPEGKGAVWFFAPPDFNPDLAILSVSPHAFIMKGAAHVFIEKFKFEYFQGAGIKTQ